MEMKPFLITVAGSCRHGLNSVDSDVDHRGIGYYPEKELMDYRVETPNVARTSTDGVDLEMWYFPHWLQNAVNGNTEFIEPLFSNDVIYSNTRGDFLVNNRGEFITEALLSQLIRSSGVVHPSETTAWLKGESSPRKKSSQLTSAFFSFKNGDSYSGYKSLADSIRRLIHAKAVFSRKSNPFQLKYDDVAYLRSVKFGKEPIGDAVYVRNHLYTELCEMCMVDGVPEPGENAFSLKTDLPERISDKDIDSIVNYMCGWDK